MRVNNRRQQGHASQRHPRFRMGPGCGQLVPLNDGAQGCPTGPAGIGHDQNVIAINNANLRRAATRETYQLHVKSSRPNSKWPAINRIACLMCHPETPGLSTAAHGLATSQLKF